MTQIAALDSRTKEDFSTNQLKNPPSVITNNQRTKTN